MCTSALLLFKWKVKHCTGTFHAAPILMAGVPNLATERESQGDLPGLQRTIFSLFSVLLILQKLPH